MIGWVDPQALSFDADQTLWDLTGVYRTGLDAVASAMVERGHVAPGDVTIDQLFDARSQVKDEFDGRPHRLEDVRERSFALVLEQLGHPDPARIATDLIDLYLQVRFDAIRLFPEVKASLKRLKPNYKLGLLSNGNTYPDRCGLPGVFHTEVFCPEHGLTKPDVRAFELVADRLDVPLAAMMHIGDDWDDIGGANAAGVTSVFINRVDSRPEWASQADYEVRDLAGLELLLESLRPPSS